MKRVIDGKTYNTASSRVVARAEWDWEHNQYTGDPEGSAKVTLYQTRGGAFFLHTCTETSRRNSEGEWRDVVRNEFEALTASEAQHWALSGSHQVELLDEAVFGEPPEAEAEDVPGATLYIRVPATLKAQLDNAAAADKLSLNAWMMRCAENCLASRRAKLEVVE